ncbi:hypothetical protein [Flavobacterium sp. YO64]|nr:hypothetical protein [Flavobacterium sp. YO64]
MNKTESKAVKAFLTVNDLIVAKDKSCDVPKTLANTGKNELYQILSEL